MLMQMTSMLILIQLEIGNSLEMPEPFERFSRLSGRCEFHAFLLLFSLFFVMLLAIFERVLLLNLLLVIGRGEVIVSEALTIINKIAALFDCCGFITIVVVVIIIRDVMDDGASRVGESERERVAYSICETNEHVEQLKHHCSYDLDSSY